MKQNQMLAERNYLLEVQNKVVHETHHRLLKLLMPQGETPSTCREDELRTKRREDRDDDPEGPRSVEPSRPSETIALGEQATAQGESEQVRREGKQPEESMEPIEALLGLDDIEDELLDYSDSELEAPVIDDVLEDGEIPPEEFNACSELPSIGLSEQSVESEDDLDHVVLKKRTSEPEIVGEPGLNVNDLKEQVQAEKKASWFRPRPPSPVFKKFIDTTGVRETTKGIKSWFYDAELKLFVIRRYDGVQYLPKSIKAFNTLPKYELRDLARLELINPSNNAIAESFRRVILREGRTGQFKTFKPQEGRYVKDKRINSRTNRPYRKIVYKRVECVTQVPLKKLPQDVLGNLKWWFVNVNTGEAEMTDHDDNCIMKVYDPIHLVNLSEADLKKLSETQIFYRVDWEDQAMEYQAVIDVCRRMMAHTGTHNKD